MPRSTSSRLAAAVSMLGLLATGCGDERPTPVEELARARQAQAADAAERADLEPDARDFLVLAAGAVGESFNVTYELEDGGRAVLLQSPPSRRVDLIAGTASDAVIRSVIVNRDGAFTCLQEEGEWRCSEDEEGGAEELGPFTASAVQDAVTSLAGSKEAFDLTVEDRRLVGHDARCLIASPRSGDAPPGVLCVSRQGAPLLVEGTGPPLRAVRYSTKVPAAALRLPADPSEG